MYCISHYQCESGCSIPVVVFNKQAENCDRYLAKGRKVAIHGRIQTGSYEKDGRTVYTTDVVANNVEFLGGGQGVQGAGQQNFAGEQQSAPAAQGGEELDIPGGFQSLQDDDIPF